MFPFFFRMNRNKFCLISLLIVITSFYLINKILSKWNYAIIQTTSITDNTVYESYPQRISFVPCHHRYGTVKVIVIYVNASYKSHYKVAQESLKCYLKSTDYELLLVDLDSDQRVKDLCPHKQLFFKKHCAVSVYLNETDWMLVLDADSGVVNPHHCIEEWIDPRVDIIFYERFFNWEIASGNYLVKNTPFVRKFLLTWADWEFIQPPNWNGADNGVLQLLIMITVMPEAKQEAENCEKIWRNGTNYDTYMAYVTCVKIYLGSRRSWPGKIRIYKRAHGWIRDGFLSAEKWCHRDFMFHGWKKQEIDIEGWTSPFTKIPNASACGAHYKEWHWRLEKKVDCKNILEILSETEASFAKSFPREARVIPYLSLPDIGNCYPNCETVL